MATNSIRRPWYSCKSTCCERSSCFRTAIAAGVGAGIYASMEETAEEFVQWSKHSNQLLKITNYIKSSMKHGKLYMTVSSL